jgi:hypothetical protein
LALHAWFAAHDTQLPAPSQTRSVPHDVPALRSPKSVQTELPVVHEVMPVMHALGLPVHAAPATHALHVPVASQTLSAPQLVPVDFWTSSTHAWAPVAHEVRPVKHGFGFVLHDRPAVHETHPAALLQTRLVPQEAPAGRAAESTHVVEPATHEVTPVLHGLGLPVQALPAVHAPQKPFMSQTWLLPHIVPALRGAPSTQACAPVEHDVTPTWQSVPGFVVQPASAMHETHAPLPLQTWFVPQPMPAVAALASMHALVPVAQLVVPVLHGAPGLVVQLWPATQARHCPLPLQTSPEPQGTPPGMLVPSTQPGLAPHAVTPDLHGWLGLVLHTAPAAQEMHAPA